MVWPYFDFDFREWLGLGGREFQFSKAGSGDVLTSKIEELRTQISSPVLCTLYLVLGGLGDFGEGFLHLRSQNLERRSCSSSSLLSTWEPGDIWGLPNAGSCL